MYGISLVATIYVLLGVDDQLCNMIWDLRGYLDSQGEAHATVGH